MTTSHRSAVRLAVVACFGALGGALFVDAVALSPSWASVAAVAALGAVMNAHPARVRPGISVSLINVALLTAAVVTAGWAVVALAAGSAVGAWRMYPPGTRTKLERLSFHFGMYAAAGLAVDGVFHALAGPGGSAQLTSVLPLLVAAIAFTLLNVGTVSILVWIDSGERPRSVLQSLGPMLLMQPAFVAYALVAAALLEIHPATLALLAVPVLMSRASYTAFQELTDSTESLLKTLISLIEQRDGYTKGHAERVAELAVMFARDLGYSHTELQTVRHAALLHDIGKVCVPLHIIRKPGRLDRDEFEAIKLHPVIGARVLADVDALRPALQGIRHHHERLDGRGYPDGLAGDEIPELVRVVSIADAFDAMTSTRSYRRALPVDEALARLVQAGGTQFDDRLVRRFLRVIDRDGWEPTVAPAEAWPTGAGVEPVDNCCAPTLSEQFGSTTGTVQAHVAEGRVS